MEGGFRGWERQRLPAGSFSLREGKDAVLRQRVCDVCAACKSAPHGARVFAGPLQVVHEQPMDAQVQAGCVCVQLVAGAVAAVAPCQHTRSVGLKAVEGEYCCSATCFGMAGLFRSQTTRRRQTSMHSRWAGVWQASVLGATFGLNWPARDGFAAPRRVSCSVGRRWRVRLQQSCFL